ncbi:MAG: hypothetical protein ACRCYY_19945 [Trueperaceae bacterium]
MQHELWLDKADNSYTFCVAGPKGEKIRKLLSGKATVVWRVEASSHFDAMTKYYTYMGWGNYKAENLELEQRSYKTLGWE